MRLLPSLSVMGVDSEASVVSAFRQPIASQASASGYSWEFQIGAALTEPLVLAGAIGQGTYRDVRAEILGRTVAVTHFQLETFSVGAVVVYFPVRELGWYGSLKLALTGLRAADDDAAFGGDSLLGPDLRGPGASLCAGHEWRLGGVWWLGGGVQAQYASTSEEGRAETSFWTAGLTGSITYF